MMFSVGMDLKLCRQQYTGRERKQRQKSSRIYTVRTTKYTPYSVLELLVAETKPPDAMFRLLLYIEKTYVQLGLVVNEVT